MPAPALAAPAVVPAPRRRRRHLLRAVLVFVLALGVALAWYVPDFWPVGNAAVLPTGLDPEAREAMRRVPELSRTLRHLGALRLVSDLAARSGRDLPLARVEDRTIPGAAGPLPVRIYTPAGRRPLPVIVYFHGGGFVMGSIAMVDRACTHLAHDNGWMVVSVGYRLAPEHPFPAAPDDALAATTWVSTHARELGADPRRVVVAGDSAGGNLAAVTTVRARDQGAPALHGQLLFYPSADVHDREAERRYPSLVRFGRGPLLTTAAMQAFARLYFRRTADAYDPRFAVMRVSDASRLPPAFIATGEFDPLRDEGEAWAGRLAGAGVRVDHHRLRGMPHGYLELVDGATRETYRLVHAFLATL